MGEHDKNPELFFDCLFRLKEENIPFLVSVLGETYSQVPQVFADAKVKLKENIVNWGHVASKEEYYRVLAGCHVVISTALHEFFGVAMLEGRCNVINKLRVELT